MQVFELHFNPKNKKEKIFESFCYEPANIYEKKLGSLYLLGEISYALPINIRLLSNISQAIRGKFYASLLQNPEKSLRESLKKANDFLSKEVSKENVSWLGNLSFAVLSLKNLELNFTKVGKIKILLLRDGTITDISKKLDFQDIEPYPLKIFSNIISGKVDNKSKLMILTQEVFDFLSETSRATKTSLKTKSSILQKTAEMEIFNEKKFREFLKAKDGDLVQISGVCLLIDFAEILPKNFLASPLPFLQKNSSLSQRAQILTFQKEFEKFSFKKVFRPIFDFFSKLKLNFQEFIRNSRKKIKKSAASLKNPISWSKILNPKLHFSFKEFVFPKKIKVKFLKIKTPQIKTKNLLHFGSQAKNNPNFKNNLLLFGALGFILLLGFFIFQGQEKIQLKKQTDLIKKSRETMTITDNLLLVEKDRQANILLQKSWQGISSLLEQKKHPEKELVDLEKEIESRLLKINKMENIAEPKLFFEFDEKEFIPQKIISSGENLYFFSPLSPNLFKLNEKGEKNLIAMGQKFNLASFVNNSIYFFSKPDKIFILNNDKFGEMFTLKLPYPDINFIEFSSFQKNLYFLDSARSEVVKYSSPLERNNDYPQLWLNPQTKKIDGVDSMAIVGSIWFLKENKLWQYYLGQLQKEINLDFFPLPKNVYKILAPQNSSYLYLMEPSQNRIIVLDKNGDVIKQFQSEKFENIKDAAVSRDGSILYLLNGVKVYQIPL